MHYFFDDEFKPRIKKNTNEFCILLLIVILSILLFGILVSNFNQEALSKQEAMNKLRNVCFYFFSTISQTMGALVAIVITFFFTIINNLKIDENKFSNIMRKRIFKDKYLLSSLFFSFISILISIISISYAGSIFIDITTFAIIGSIVLTCSIIGIFKFVIFSIKRAYLYNNPIDLLYNDFYINNELSIDKDRDKEDYLEICILLHLSNKHNRLISKYYDILEYGKLNVESIKAVSINIRNNLFTQNLSSFEGFQNQLIDLFEYIFSPEKERILEIETILITYYNKELLYFIIEVSSYDIFYEYFLNFMNNVSELTIYNDYSLSHYIDSNFSKYWKFNDKHFQNKYYLLLVDLIISGCKKDSRYINLSNSKFFKYTINYVFKNINIAKNPFFKNIIYSWTTVQEYNNWIEFNLISNLMSILYHSTLFSLLEYINNTTSSNNHIMNLIRRNTNLLSYSIAKISKKIVTTRFLGIKKIIDQKIDPTVEMMLLFLLNQSINSGNLFIYNQKEIINHFNSLIFNEDEISTSISEALVILNHNNKDEVMYFKFGYYFNLKFYKSFFHNKLTQKQIFRNFNDYLKKIEKVTESKLFRSANLGLSINSFYQEAQEAWEELCEDNQEHGFEEN